MSSEQPEPQQPDPDGGPLTMTAIGRMIDEKLGAMVGKLFDSGKADVVEARPGGDPAPGRGREDVTAQVRAEVQKLRDDDARQADSKSMAERVAELEKTLAKMAENKPEEYRPITERLWR